MDLEGHGNQNSIGILPVGVGTQNDACTIFAVYNYHPYLYFNYIMDNIK